MTCSYIIGGMKVRNVIVSNDLYVFINTVDLQHLDTESSFLACLFTFIISMSSVKMKGMWPVLHIWHSYLLFLCHIYVSNSGINLCWKHVHLNTNNFDIILSICYLVAIFVPIFTFISITPKIFLL